MSVSVIGGLVLFDQSGFHPRVMVVLVACTPSVGWSSWWASARSIKEPVVQSGSRKVD